MMIRTLVPLSLVSLALVTTPLRSQEVPDHADLTRLLTQVVKTPQVDYPTLQARQDDLSAYLDQLSATDMSTLAAASAEVQLAFWINAYNACMLHRVASHYPIRKNAGLLGSIRNAIADYPDNSVWQIRDVFTGAFCPVAGSTRSLDEIEHEIIRPMGDPRIHFAINCAAASCPPLAPEAYVAEKLDDQLDRAVRDVIANPEHFAMDRSGSGSVMLHRVLDWFGEDFGGTPGVLRFLAEYLPEADAEFLTSPGIDVGFFEYDWTLNDTEAGGS